MIVTLATFDGDSIKPSIIDTMSESIFLLHEEGCFSKKVDGTVPRSLWWQFQCFVLAEHFYIVTVRLRDGHFHLGFRALYIGGVTQKRQTMVKKFFSPGHELTLFPRDHLGISGQPGKNLNNVVVS